VSASLEVAAALVRETRFRKEVIAARLEDGFLDATTLMEYLVAQGVPMRSAHEAVGKLVRLCLERRAGWPTCQRKCTKGCGRGSGRGYIRCWE
jgi:argininosuccinate lyase